MHLSEVPTLGLQMRLHQPSKKNKLCGRLTGDTDVDVSIEVAVGSWVACDWALACRSPADALMLTNVS